MTKAINNSLPADYVGKTGMFAVPIRGTSDVPFKIKVRIDDARAGFGRLDFKIVPIGGEGEAWVSSEAVTVNKGKAKR